MKVAIEGDEIVVRMSLNSLQSELQKLGLRVKVDDELLLAPRIVELLQNDDWLIYTETQIRLRGANEEGDTLLTKALEGALVMAVGERAEGLSFE